MLLGPWDDQVGALCDTLGAIHRAGIHPSGAGAIATPDSPFGRGASCDEKEAEQGAMALTL